tara:strand:+ start:795 stop:2309 length:1515 start_codon:yes stop_codon:yes gene_type:complete
LQELKYTYPADILESPSDEQLRRVAKKLVELEYGRYAIGPIEKDEKVLILTPVHQDQRLLEAIKQAMMDKGAGEIDVVSEAEVQNFKITPNFTAERAWDELAFFPAWFGYRRHIEEDSDATQAMRDTEWNAHHTFKVYMDKQPKKYDKLLGGMAGYSHYKAIVGGAYKSLFPFSSYEYAKLYADFPQDVWSMVENRIKDLMPIAEEVRIRDLEGTDITFTITEEEAILWREESQPSNHLFMYPRPPEFPEANGVIAGTSNHFGFFPYTKVYVKHGLVEKIEGEGKFQDMWRGYHDRYQKEQYPDFPSPGYYYIHECALATNPRGFRHIKELFDTPIFMTNDSERNRAGTLHWGFGLQALDFIERQRPVMDKFDKVMKFCKEKNLPYCHSAHIHNNFITYEIRPRNSKQWIKLVDKGWITLFDDPEIRKVAAKHGNPDEIFKYDWIPAIPGITYEGNYFKDYAKDPLYWIKHEIKEIIPKFTGGTVKEEVGQSVVPHAHEHTTGH